MRLLVAEDEPIVRLRLVGLLKSFGCQVVTVHADGLSAQAWLEDNPGAVDALILDIRMPGLSGLDLATAHPDLPVVYVTALAEHAVEAWEQAAAGYLVKPVTPAKLEATLQRLERRLGPRA